MKALQRKLYVQVIIAIIFGILCGYVFPEFSVKLKCLGDAFIAIINVLIAPIIFCTIVCGICSNDDMKHVSGIVTKALIYFTIMTSLSLVIGLVAVNLFKPGVGMNVDVNSLDTSSISNYLTAGTSFDIFSKIIPKSFVGAFTSGEILQVLFVAILTAIGLSALGARGKPIVHAIEKISELTFKIIAYVMYLAPIGAFGAMAFTVGKFGINTLSSLMGLVGLLYLTSAFFVIVILGFVMKLCGLNIFKFVHYLREEIFIVLGTGSSETVLPRLIDKMEKMGCPDSAVSIVVPTGYSFNLDGTAIALSMVAMFIAQATNTEVSL
ncbi:MAG: cation:dicarboxylase symporter family transporter, partial [Silvanigrellaceae bacterium]|nr:cation:dicarboxylase symporter family transporter [Silvanigrellaceae bacterium]